MDTLKTILDKVNAKTNNSPIIYAANDPERALGLEQHLHNYHILCIDDNEINTYIRNKNIPVFSLEEELHKLNLIYRNTNRLLNHDLTKAYLKDITSSGSANLMFFKIAPNLEKTAKQLGYNILNTSSELNRKYELKISQYEALRDIGVRIPKTIIITLEDADFDTITAEVGEHFALQFNRGHTGKGTEFIENKTRLDEIKRRFPKRTVRIAKFIKGDAYTINACVTKHGICYGGLSYQLTGIEELTQEKAGTVGNDWSHTESLSDIIKEDMYKMTETVGKAMQKDGFVGMFGLDFVIEEDTRAAFLIEINARQPASIPMFTKMQLMKQQIPLSLLAIAEFLDIEYTIDTVAYNEQATEPLQYAQVFIRNTLPKKAKVIGGVKPGSYRLSGTHTAYQWKNGKKELQTYVIFLEEDKATPLVFVEEDYAIDTIDEGGFMLLSPKEGKIISPNAEVARVQMKQSAIGEDGKIIPWVKMVLLGLKQNIILKEVYND